MSQPETERGIEREIERETRGNKSVERETKNERERPRDKNIFHSSQPVTFITNKLASKRRAARQARFLRSPTPLVHRARSSFPRCRFINQKNPLFFSFERNFNTFRSFFFLYPPLLLPPQKLVTFDENSHSALTCSLLRERKRERARFVKREKYFCSGPHWKKREREKKTREN